ncbi:hypothetical protein [Streptomyces sp. NBC_00151]|jgi:hypothetical protein|nr:hypothetical protein [Streptomyces sp. NBC_00151]WRZ43916.1 hypothetical protein OG915_41280 [Streptomyces sp. NBC_00151]
MLVLCYASKSTDVKLVRGEVSAALGELANRHMRGELVHTFR